MRMMLLAGLLITLPAIIVVMWNFGGTRMLPAFASLVINSLPFLVAAWLMRGHQRNSDDMEDEH